MVEAFGSTTPLTFRTLFVSFTYCHRYKIIIFTSTKLSIILCIVINCSYEILMINNKYDKQNVSLIKKTSFFRKESTVLHILGSLDVTRLSLMS